MQAVGSQYPLTSVAEPDPHSFSLPDPDPDPDPHSIWKHLRKKLEKCKYSKLLLIAILFVKM